MPGIIKLTVSNLLRLKAAEVTPDGALVVVAGNNDQGKSSLLNSIAIALSGKDVPQQPIRQGATQGFVILETDDLVVTRSFSQTGGSKLEVRDKEGKVTAPQAKLDTLTSRIAFDPLEFTKQAPDKQAETVRRIAGLDFAALDSSYAKTYEARTELGRRVKMKDGELQSIVRTPDAPAEEVSVAALAEELQTAQATNAKNADVRLALSEMNDDVDTHEGRCDTAAAAIALLQAQLEAAKKRLDDERALLADQIKMRDETKAKVEKLEDVPTEPILTRIREADGLNAQVRANKQWSQAHRDLTTLKGEQSELTARLEGIEKQKADALANAKFPVDGLGFTDAGVTYKGVPFEQAGSAVKILVSLAIARSLNPALPVMFIKDGSLLDAESLGIVEKYAEEHGCQVWLECVGDRDDATVVIEDGNSVQPTKKKKK